jgi:2'-5' RNA ligase
MTEGAVAQRSFVAVPLPGAVQAALVAAAGELARELPGVKWTRKPENLHVTMKFLGLVAPDRLAALADALREALGEVPRFELALRGFGAFPSPRNAKILFADVTDAESRLAMVAELVEAVGARFGFDRDQRPFAGHVTMGRAKEGVDARDALARRAGRAFGVMPVDEVHLYESQLGGEGSTYVLRHRAPLNARAN